MKARVAAPVYIQGNEGYDVQMYGQAFSSYVNNL
jgi:hypothetical protein